MLVNCNYSMQSKSGRWVRCKTGAAAVCSTGGEQPLGSSQDKPALPGGGIRYSSCQKHLGHLNTATLIVRPGTVFQVHEQ